MPQLQAIALEAPLVASPNQTMKALLVSRATLYTLLNAGELESYTEGRARRISVESITSYVKRRLEAEAARRAQKAAE
jgi:excisionase family DNA binding protein